MFEVLGIAQRLAGHGCPIRVINGADAARFLVELKKLMEEPFVAWL